MLRGLLAAMMITAMTPFGHPQEFTLVSTVNLVVLDVSVKDARGAFVSGLARDRFQVFDNGVKQPITVFTNEDLPITMGLVIDHSASMRPKSSDVVTAALTLIRQSNPKDEVFVVTFNDSVYFRLPHSTPFTDDQEVLRAALVQTAIQGRTALYDAVQASLQHLEHGARARKALVVVSDGGDNASGGSEQQIAEFARLSRATIYTIGIYDDYERDRNPGFLKRLANLTGGESFFPTRFEELGPIASGIARDIRSRYTLAFTPPESNAGVTHSLRVTVTGGDHGKLMPRTRKSYAIPRSVSGTALP
jgi:VWFA-related protein